MNCRYLPLPKYNGVSAKGQKESGQIAIEYILILFVAVTIAYTLISGLVSRDQSSPGIIVQRWSMILEAVGKDLADSPAP